MNFSYLSKIVLGLLVFLYPLFSYADSMVEPTSLEISRVSIITLIPVVLSAVLLFMFRKKGVPLQPKPKTPIEKTHKEKRVLKLIKCFIIWGVLTTVFLYSFQILSKYSTPMISVSEFYQINVAISVLMGLSAIGVLIGIFSVIAMIFSMLFKKKESVRAIYWFLLFMVSYLPAQCFLSFVRMAVYRYFWGPERIYYFVILTQILFLLAIVVGLVVGYYKKIKKRRI